jgi:predicted O-methyltransferase YrrM
VQYVVGESQWVLPTLEPVALDFVLIDGDHAFPTPFLDWYYAAERLRVGGLVMIDDIPLRTGAVLDDFLRAEVSRWRAVERLSRTVVYEKLTPTVLDFAGWMSQPWCMRHGSLIKRARARVRLRTRLRALARRRGY